jgi:hypothetical protein
MKKVIKHYRVIKSDDKKTSDKKKVNTQVNTYISYYELFKSISK